ncbi:DUF1806 family protein, partial [Staphylococcus aureus]
GGWVYVQGLTHYEINDNNEFLIAGSNYEGQLAATIEISEQPFTWRLGICSRPDSL